MDLLPLPLPEWSVEDKSASGETWNSHCWLRRVVNTLNIAYQHPSSFALVGYFGASTCRLSKVQAAAMKNLKSTVEYFVDLPDGRVSERDWPAFMAARDITYPGEVQAKSQRLPWRQMLPGLPPQGMCGKINALDLCEGVMRELLLDPGLTVKPVEQVAHIPPHGKCMVVPGEELLIATQLLDYGLVAPIDPSEVPVFGDRLLLNGHFGVGKGSYVDGDGQPGSESLEVLRWILNLTVSNSVMISLRGDVDKLPSPTQWKNIVLRDGEEAVWSYDDLKGCFYLFAFQRGWMRHFCLGQFLARADLGLPGPGGCYLGCTVCPMGFTNAMSIIQYLHRRMMIMGSKILLGLPPSRELRKDRALPLMRGDVEDLATIWEIFCDDLDVIEILLKEWRKMMEDPAPGSIDKGGVRKSIGVRSGTRYGTFVGLTGYILRQPTTSQKDLQIVCGRWTHLMQTRRGTSSFLDRVWQHAIKLGPYRRAKLPPAIRCELIRCMLMVPLMSANLRAPISSLVTASDASEYAQGCCSSNALTEWGIHESLPDLAGSDRPGCDSMGILTVGDQLGSLRFSFDFMRIRIAAHAAVVEGLEAERLHLMTWPDAAVQRKDTGCRGTDLCVGAELIRKFSWEGLHLRRVLFLDSINHWTTSKSVPHWPVERDRLLENLAKIRRTLVVPKTSFIIEMLPARNRHSMERIFELRDLLQGRLVRGTPRPLTARSRPRWFITSWNSEVSKHISRATQLSSGWDEETALGDRIEDIETSVGFGEGHTLAVWKKADVAADARGYREARRRALDCCMAPNVFCILLRSVLLTWKELKRPLKCGWLANDREALLDAAAYGIEGFSGLSSLSHVKCSLIGDGPGLAEARTENGVCSGLGAGRGWRKRARVPQGALRRQLNGPTKEVAPTRGRDRAELELEKGWGRKRARSLLSSMPKGAETRPR